MNFEKHSYNDWMALVQKYIKDKPLDSFIHEIYPGLNYQPFAHPASSPDLAPLDLDFEHKFGAYIHADLSKEDTLLLLKNGCQALAFNLQSDVSKSLDGIHLDYIAPIFLGSKSTSEIEAYILANHQDRPIPKVYFEDKTELSTQTIECRVYKTSDLDPIAQIVDLCQQYKNGPDANPAFLVPTSEQFMLEIARLRALRILISNVQQNMGWAIRPIEIITQISPVKPVDSHDYALIQNTAIAMSSIIGTANITLIDTKDKASNDNRLNLHVLNILHMESNLHAPSDVMGGSYFIEDLTEKIAKLVWERLT